MSIKPDWSKGYSRLSAAHFGKAQYDDAIQAAEEGEQAWVWGQLKAGTGQGVNVHPLAAEHARSCRLEARITP